MGIELIAIGIGVAISAAASGYAIYQGSRAKNDSMGPNGLDSFNMTRTQEGLAVPIIYGKVRIPGNIIWFGDLVTKPIKAKGGGKGMGGSGGVSGYKYYISCWQAISMGKIEITKTYVNDKEQEIEATSTIFNNGTLTVFPTNIPKANKLPGVAHIYYDHWYIGDNVSNIPNVHFVVNRILDLPIENSNLPNGSNPASIIYDLLLMGAILPTEIDLDSFQIAANSWASLGIGLNLVFSEQNTIGEAIGTVLKFVDAVVYVNRIGKYAIQGFFNFDSIKAEISEEEIKNFSMNRKTWGQIKNDFSATFIDESLDFSQRSLRFQNPAAIVASGAILSYSIDLKCYRDVSTASKCLFDIMVQESYPKAELKFTTNLSYSMLLPGDIIRLQMPSLSIENADFRVTNIDNATPDKNEINIQASQKIDGMFDISDIPGGGSGWVPPNYNLTPFIHTKIFELPFNYTTKKESAYLLLVARERLIETGFAILFSNFEEGDYTSQGIFSSFSQYGTLDVEYPANTNNIDDTIGIVYTPYKKDPEFISQSRTDLFSSNRAVICGNEIMGFERVIPEGNSYRILGVIRGVLNTPIEFHAVDSEIWLCEISELNTLVGITSSNFWLKFIPIFNQRALDASLVTAQNILYEGKASIPTRPAIRATRIVNNVSFEIFPITTDKQGAGTQPENIYISPGPSPYTFEGDFEVFDGSTITYKTTTNFTLELLGETIVTIKHRVNGITSEESIIVIGEQDKIYYSS